MADDKPERGGLTLWEVIGSTFAAVIGVQKKVNKERDFTHGRPSQFIVAGLIFTAVFVLVVYGVVKLILALTGA
ncbi:MAG: DUF2970 domain-containing protein [Gammaproteobacteria bacterium]|nr:DUF2970 domain-containing protein [Gammaproteobacteria bacterium]